MLVFDLWCECSIGGDEILVVDDVFDGYYFDFGSLCGLDSLYSYFY